MKIVIIIVNHFNPKRKYEEKNIVKGFDTRAIQGQEFDL